MRVTCLSADAHGLLVACIIDGKHQVWVFVGLVRVKAFLVVDYMHGERLVGKTVDVVDCVPAVLLGTPYLDLGLSHILRVVTLVWIAFLVLFGLDSFLRRFRLIGSIDLI